MSRSIPITGPGEAVIWRLSCAQCANNVASCGDGAGRNSLIQYPRAEAGTFLSLLSERGFRPHEAGAMVLVMASKGDGRLTVARITAEKGRGEPDGVNEERILSRF